VLARDDEHVRNSSDMYGKCVSLQCPTIGGDGGGALRASGRRLALSELKS
jgi:hypothetical protein